jgi:hypothetical protein
MKAIDLGMIQARRAKLDADIARLRDEISMLEAKRAELDVAEHVFAEIALEDGEGNRQSTKEEAASNETHDAAGTGNGYDNNDHFKPEGLPFMTAMIIEAIRHANSLGAQGLDPAGLRSYIRGRYWPTVPATAVGPIAWRMWKREELTKRGELYSLPERR